MSEKRYNTKIKQVASIKKVNGDLQTYLHHNSLNVEE